MKLIPIYDTTAPIACTVSAGEIAERIEHIRANLNQLHRSGHEMVLRFPNRPAIEATSAGLRRREAVLSVLGLRRHNWRRANSALGRSALIGWCA